MRANSYRFKLSENRNTVCTEHVIQI